jgi:putative hemolysin
LIVVVFSAGCIKPDGGGGSPECRFDSDCEPAKPLAGARYVCEAGLCKTKPFGNPASEYCEEHGGVLEIQADASGGQTGVCVFKDGSRCEEWAYMRGECLSCTEYCESQPHIQCVGKLSVSGSFPDCKCGFRCGSTIAQECESDGGSMQVFNTPTGNRTYCVFPDESFCERELYRRGDCERGKCFKRCGAVGTRSEGWYDNCTGALIAWENCA